MSERGDREESERKAGKNEEEETAEKNKYSWRSPRREKWTVKTELSTRNGQTPSCSFFPLGAQNQCVSYAQRL